MFSVRCEVATDPMLDWLACKKVQVIFRPELVNYITDPLKYVFQLYRPLRPTSIAYVQKTISPSTHSLLVKVIGHLMPRLRIHELNHHSLMSSCLSA